MSRPGPPNVRRKPEVAPEEDELINVDESADIVFRAFGQHDLVDLRPLPAVGEIPPSARAAPADMARKLDQSRCLDNARVAYVCRRRDRPYPSLSPCRLSGVETIGHISMVEGARDIHRHVRPSTNARAITQEHRRPCSRRMSFHS